MKNLLRGLIGKNRKKRMLATAFMAVFALMILPFSASASAPPSNELEFGSGGFSFDIGDIIGSAWNFIAGFDDYVLLILALIVVPTLVGFVIWLMSKLPRFRKSAG